MRVRGAPFPPPVVTEARSGMREAAEADRRRVPTAEELLYDDERDSRDEAWVRKHLLRAGTSCLGSRSPASIALIKGQPWARASGNDAADKDGEHRSDAVLSCPCCLSPLCYDCQRY